MAKTRVIVQVNLTKRGTFKTQPCQNDSFQHRDFNSLCLNLHLHQFINLIFISVEEADLFLSSKSIRPDVVFWTSNLTFLISLRLNQPTTLLMTKEVLDTMIVPHQHYLDPAGKALLSLLLRINAHNAMSKAVMYI